MRKLPVPADFVRVLAPALRQAAAIARTLEGRVVNRPKVGEVTEIKAALTIADSAAQEALLVPLLERFPQVRLEAEENTPSVARFPSRGDALVVIDPIDGTLRFYLEAQGPYAVMLGLAVRNVYQAALLALPREGLYLEAVRGGGARRKLGERSPEVARAEASGRRVLVSHDLPGPACDILRARGFEVAPASGGAISVAPLLPGVCGGLRFVGGGPVGVSVRGRIGVLIAAEAGVLVRAETGEPFPDDIRAPARALLVAADEVTLAALLDAAAAR